VDQRRIVELLDREAVFPTLIECARGAFQDFDTYVGAEVRVSVERARPKFVSCRMLARLELMFGVTGPRRMIREGDQMSYRLVEGDEFDVGIRGKKLNRHMLSYNHRSGRQDELRDGECFPEMAKPTAHVFLGYQARGGLEPGITKIALTSEFQDLAGRWQLRWAHTLWVEAAAIHPIQPVIEDEMFPQPQVRRRRRPGTDEATEQQG
jgi:hypothetical protein